MAGGWAPLCIMQTLGSTVAALIFALHTVSYLHYKLSNANMTATTQCLLNNSIICRNEDGESVEEAIGMCPLCHETNTDGNTIEIQN